MHCWRQVAGDLHLVSIWLWWPLDLSLVLGLPAPMHSKIATHKHTHAFPFYIFQGEGWPE